MTCDQSRAAQLLGAPQKGRELHDAVALYAGVGRKSAQIALGERRHDLLAELPHKVEHIKGHPQPERHGARILRVVQRTACAPGFNAGVFVVEQAHRAADARETLPHGQQRRHGGIHAPAHGNESLTHRKLLIRRKAAWRDSGRRCRGGERRSFCPRFRDASRSRSPRGAPLRRRCRPERPRAGRSAARRRKPLPR